MNVKGRTLSKSALNESATGCHEGKSPAIRQGMFRALLAWAVLLPAAGALLGGCLVTELQPGEPFTPDPAHGVAVLSLSRTGVADFDLLLQVRGVDRFFHRPLLLRARGDSLDWGDRENRPIPPEAPRGRLAALVLEPGDYEFSGWSGDSQMYGFYGDGYLINGPLSLPFTVQPGRIVYVGALRLELPPKPNWLANLGTATYRLRVEDHAARDLALFRSRFPALSGEPVAVALLRPVEPERPPVYYVYNKRFDGDCLTPDC
jgi:hypothetical protein